MPLKEFLTQKVQFKCVSHSSHYFNSSNLAVFFLQSFAFSPVWLACRIDRDTDPRRDFANSESHFNHWEREWMIILSANPTGLMTDLKTI